MANRKISDLTALTAPATGDLLPIVDISEVAAADKNKKITYGELLASAPAGSAAAPSFSFDSDPNTGLYRVGAEVIGFTTNGTAKATIDDTAAPIKEIFSSVYYPIATQVDVGTDPNQVPLNGLLGTMAFQDSAGVNLDQATITQINNVPLLAGGGLKFPPTQIPSADPNTLDDYEEGTWTPNVTNTGYTYTYSNQTGTYTKVGRKVTLSWRVAVTARSGSAGGGLPVVALPFTPSASFTGSALMSPQPAQLVIHKAATGSTSGIRTFLYSGLANGNPTYFWIGAIATTGNSFDIGSDFQHGRCVHL
jgi:hypothetical protein